MSNHAGLGRAFKLLSGIAAAGAAALAASAAEAQNFYQGKTISIYIDVSPGGEKDILTRLVGRHLGEQIPGRPSVVAQNMPGAGGLRMVNHLYSVAAQDGTAIGHVASNMPMLQVIGTEGVQFDSAKFHWIGSVAPVVGTIGSWSASGVKTLEDAKNKEVIAGSIGAGGMTYILPRLMNSMLGTKFKVVMGYQGGSEIYVAMERGEVDARQNAWSAWKLTKPDWVRDGKVSILVQAGSKADDLPNVPLLEDLAKTPEDRSLIELITSGYTLGKPIVAAPGTPPDRVTILRRAFDAVMKDPKFLAESEQLGIEVEPQNGEEIQNVVVKVVNTSPKVVERAMEIMK